MDIGVPGVLISYRISSWGYDIVANFVVIVSWGFGDEDTYGEI